MRASLRIFFHQFCSTMSLFHVFLFAHSRSTHNTFTSCTSVCGRRKGFAISLAPFSKLPFPYRSHTISPRRLFSCAALPRLMVIVSLVYAYFFPHISFTMLSTVLMQTYAISLLRLNQISACSSLSYKTTLSCNWFICSTYCASVVQLVGNTNFSPYPAFYVVPGNLLLGGSQHASHILGPCSCMCWSPERSPRVWYTIGVGLATIMHS
jgi:hypothetical protein